VGRGRDHALEAALVGLDDHDVAVGAQRGEHRGRQFLRGELGLFLVVVDVVAGDDFLLRRLARLAGAQHDAHVVVVERLADVLHQVQAGLVALHHHVEQDHRDVVVLGEHLLGLGGGGGREDQQRAVLELEAGQHQAGDLRGSPARRRRAALPRGGR
jgi:hypothetical protein